MWVTMQDRVYISFIYIHSVDELNSGWFTSGAVLTRTLSTRLLTGGVIDSGHEFSWRPLVSISPMWTNSVTLTVRDFFESCQLAIEIRSLSTSTCVSFFYFSPALRVSQTDSTRCGPSGKITDSVQCTWIIDCRPSTMLYQVINRRAVHPTATAQRYARDTHATEPTDAATDWAVCNKLYCVSSRSRLMPNATGTCWIAYTAAIARVCNCVSYWEISE